MLYRLFLATVGLAVCAQASSIAESLAGYSATLKVTSISGITATNISGVTFHPGSKTLYADDNGNENIYELDTNGKLLRTITTSGFQDIEGIAHQTDRYFYIAEEGTSSVVRISIPASGTGPVARSSGVALTLGSGWGNNGLEGVSYCPVNKTVYAVKERVPPRLYRIACDSAGDPVTAYANDPFNIESKSGDAADILALTDGNFLLVDQEENKLVGYSAQGLVLSELSLKEMTQPEGIGMDTLSGTIYIAGEPRQLFVFKKAVVRCGDRAFQMPQINARITGQMNSRQCIIRLSIPFPARVTVDFVTIQGKRITTFIKTAAPGMNIFALDPGAQSAGLVICRIKAGFFEQSVRIPAPR
jgi:uncharacterized protein YjiK